MAESGPHEVVPGVYRLGTSLVNWYVVEEGGRLTAVDAGLSGFGKTLREDLRALGHGPEDVEAVVLTHADADHTGLVPALHESGARVLVHAADDAALRSPGPKSGDASPRHLLAHLWRLRFWRTMGHMARRGGAKPPKFEGAETFAGTEVLDVPGSPRVIPTPGHTPGHCALHFETRGALFAGDALCMLNPLTGATGPQVMPSAFNVDTGAAFSALEAIEGLEPSVVLPGHGEPWLDGPSEAVRLARAAGRS